jgi:arylsulfatase A-like enzyme
MDKLAEQGVYFKNAFVTTPICAASRASILTGLYERTHGYTFGQVLQESYASESYPLQLKIAGYHTGFFGKFGIKYPGFKSLFDVADDYDRDVKYPDKRGYFYKTINGDSTLLTEYTAYQAKNFINDAPADQPFLLTLCFSAPHAHDPAKDQYFWTDAVDKLYQDVKIPGPVMGQKKYFDAQPDYVKKSESRTRWFWRYDTPEHYQQSMKGYYRMISEVDIQIGKIRAQLTEKGLADNTVIIFMGDNGYFYGERQLAGKWLMYDNSLRVPMIIYDPRNPTHRDVDDVALNIDIAPTILEFAGVKAPSLWQGKSLEGYVKGENPTENRQEFIAEHLWKVNIIPASEGYRTPKWKYFRYQADLDHEELYNLKKDPLEKNNLANKSKYQNMLEEMRSKFEEKAAELESMKIK